MILKLLCTLYVIAASNDISSILKKTYSGIRPNINQLYRYEGAASENQLYTYLKTKAQISYAVTAQLICAFVFTPQLV